MASARVSPCAAGATGDVAVDHRPIRAAIHGRSRTPVTTIGIVAGSGPEAGLDLWRKVLAAARHQQGGDYRGDTDAPRVVVVSEPELGLSMDIEQREADVWTALEATVGQLAAQVDHYAIACNTLHYFAPRLRALDLDAELISVVDVARTYVDEHDLDTVGLLGARQVTELGHWSPYGPLTESATVVTTSRREELHQLIHDVKTHGPDHPGLAEAWAAVVADTPADTLLVACTELPLLPRPPTPKTLVDVTELVAGQLARLALTPPP